MQQSGTGVLQRLTGQPFLKLAIDNVPSIHRNMTSVKLKIAKLGQTHAVDER